MTWVNHNNRLAQNALRFRRVDASTPGFRFGIGTAASAVNPQKSVKAEDMKMSRYTKYRYADFMVNKVLSNITRL